MKLIISRTKKIRKLIKWAKYYEIELLFSVLTLNALKLISKYNFPKYKIASRTLKENFDLAKKS